MIFSANSRIPVASGRRSSPSDSGERVGSRQFTQDSDGNGTSDTNVDIHVRR